MKKNVWLLGVAVAALTSCTQNEVLEVPESKLIRFESHVEKPTRAVDDLLSSTFANAWIFGYNVPNDDPNATPDFTKFGDNETNVETVFNEAPLTKTTTGNVTSWVVDDEKHWKTNRSYRFAAYSDGNTILANNVVTYNPETDKLNISTYKVVDDDDTGTPKDLVAVIAGDRHSTSGGTPVNLQFKHLLSKVTFYITNASANADLHLTGIDVNDIYKTASCECTYANNAAEVYPKNVKWTGTSTEEFDINDIEIPFQAGSTTHKEVTYYFIPQPNANATLTLHLAEKMGDDVHYAKDETFSLATGVTKVRNDYTVTDAWVPGYHYKYTLRRGTNFQQIEFTVGVDTWNGDRDGNSNVEDADNVPLVTPTP